MVAAVKPTPDPSRARSPGRPLDIPEADWSEAVRREATVRVLAASGVNSRSVVHAAAASLGISPAQVYRLIARFRRHPVTSSLVVTKPGPKKGVRLLAGEIELRIEAAIDTVFKQRERPTLEKLRRDIRKDCDAAGLKAPSCKAVQPQGDWLPELLRNRYIRLWIFRHRHLAPERLIATLANALDTARDQHRDIVLPELSAAPIVPAPPVKPLTRGRPPPRRRSRGG
jgi:hypothetical protein